MQPENEQPIKDLTYESLEAELRGLPQPTVPPGLEAKLLAAIPVGPPTAASRRPRRWLGAVGLLAAAAGLILTVGIWDSVARSWKRPGASRVLNDTSQQCVRGEGSDVLLQETDPWSIWAGRRNSG